MKHGHTWQRRTTNPKDACLRSLEIPKLNIVGPFLPTSPEIKQVCLDHIFRHAQTMCPRQALQTAVSCNVPASKLRISERTLNLCQVLLLQHQAAFACSVAPRAFPSRCANSHDWQQAGLTKHDGTPYGTLCIAEHSVLWWCSSITMGVVLSLRSELPHAFFGQAAISERIHTHTFPRSCWMNDLAPS